jgi:hypothetical protein
MPSNIESKKTNAELIREIQDSLQSLKTDTNDIRLDLVYIKQKIKDREETEKQGWFWN